MIAPTAHSRSRPTPARPKRARLARALILTTALAACGDDTQHQGSEATSSTPPPSNRIDVPREVRDNLDIRFGTVERRKVAATLRAPGAFELLPAAVREHRAMLAGLVEVRVELLQKVEPGDLLATLDAPEWRTRQREIADLSTEIELARARREALNPLIAAHEKHERSVKAAIAVQRERIAELEATRREVGGQAAALASAKVMLSQLEAKAAEVTEQHVATRTRIIELEAAQRSNSTRRELAVAAAATLLGVTPAELKTTWQRAPHIEIRARTAGVVERVATADGRFVEPGDLLLVVTDPTKLRFRAHTPQSDLARLDNGHAARIAPPSGLGGETLTGKLELGTTVDERTRMVELFVTASPAPAWARAGLAGVLEVVTDETASAEIAVPRSAVQRDGLTRVLFRRDGKKPDEVIRVEPEFGISDGEWIVVKTDLTDGDEIVVAGAYELMLESSATSTKGGHFHADGTWHADH